MNRVKMSKRARLLAGSLAVSASGWAGLAPLLAQEVVQALPPRESAQLSTALRRLAARPGDLEALVTAGNASLALNDPGVAAGFFARAAQVAPGDSRVVLGQARVALQQRRPVEALQGFERAEDAGVRPLDMAADRALAYDLVGDNAAAQALYRNVLASGESSDVRRRLALSYAIAGNRPEFERTLYPLLRDEDRSAYRTRAFGLAILGFPDDAVEIADAMMPTDLALRMAPYLRYMPRLTKSQQAAAGNLGAFPAATEIGRDPADIAGYGAAGARIAARADTSLTPSGEALGPRAGTGSVRRRPESTAPTASRPAPAPAPAVRIAQATPAPSPTPVVRIAQPTPAPSPAVAPPVIVAASQAAPAPAPTLTPEPEPEILRPSLAEAFADIGPAPSASTGPAAGAVDVAKLDNERRAAEAKAAKQAEAKAKAAKEAEAKLAKAKAEKAAKAADPARHWVQVGVGRNTSAFAFDWKKLAKQAGGALDGKGPWAVKYGATNRMLAGPFPSEAAARTAIKQLKGKDIEALPFSSAEGEKVSKAS